MSERADRLFGSKTRKVAGPSTDPVTGGTYTGERDRASDQERNRLRGAVKRQDISDYVTGMSARIAARERQGSSR